MLGNFLIGDRNGSPTKNRVFVYEVTGLKQSETNDSNSYPFRNSSSVFLSVPYNRMNEEMQRIGKMGGTIVNIQSLNDFQNPSETENTNNNNSNDSEG
ncbi:phycobilisome linker polypeptide [Pleurocapsa sp. PCC 7319]|uniref:phycobilisome linker polypeptide n=1 Tax=Pleurocapsa sp. PCC 7319 TaxID=118161 RepID=UPI00034B85F5|nr:phycobilisome linker polypeptide [Pleurocapsa sp. PCC 7319]